MMIEEHFNTGRSCFIFLDVVACPIRHALGLDTKDSAGVFCLQAGPVPEHRGRLCSGSNDNGHAQSDRI